MSTGRLQIPAELEPAMRQFARDFDAMAQHWVDACEECAQSVAMARAGLRAYLADPADPDEYGVSRADRLRHVFEFWRGLVVEMRRSRSAEGVRPVLPFEAEVRLADLWWKRRNG